MKLIHSSLIIITVLLFQDINAATYTSQESGDWSTISWTPSTPSANLNNNDTIIIQATDTVVLNGLLEFNNNCALIVYGGLTIENGFEANNDVDIIVVGDLTINGPIDVWNNAAVDITGNADINGNVDLHNNGVLDVDGILDIDGTLSGHNGNNLIGTGIVIADNISGINTSGFNGYINPTNLYAPTVLGESFTVNEGGTYNSLNLLTNDSDGDGDLLSVSTTAISDPAQGSLLLNSDGSFSYTALGDNTGGDSFTYEVCDNGTPFRCTNGIVTITINNINDAPTAIDDAPPAIDEETSITAYDLLANDSDIDGDNLTITTAPASGVSNGSLTINANGTFDYSPNINFTGTDSFQYEICDDGSPSLCSNATVTIIVTNVNDTPTPTDDTPPAIDEETSITNYNIIANDTDPDGDILTINTFPATNVSNGSLIINANGTFNYTPNVNFSGTDNFEYEVCDNGSPTLCATATVTITVNNINDKPIATDDNPAAIDEETNITGSSIIGNDSDPDNDIISISTIPVSGVTNGVLTINANGTFNYTPNADFYGTDSFEYKLCDNGSPSLCDTGLVTILVNNINDAPAALEDTPPAIDEETSISGYNLLANDSDVDGDIISINTTPVANVSNGILTINAVGTFNYTPTPDFTGTDSFEYQICDNGSPQLCATASVIITVNNVNDKPIATDDNPPVFAEETNISGYDILANDTDPDNDILSISTTPVTNVSSGTLLINTDGTFDYSPNANFYGTDSFEYEVCDNGSPSLCDTALVTLLVSNVNDAPNINADGPIVINEETPISNYDLLANDTDIDGNAITINITPVSPVSHGSLTINADGTFDYTPDSDYSGSDTFTYRACDNGVPSKCNNAVVSITIVNVNDNPVAVADAPAAINEETSITGYDLLSNDSDPEGNTITINTTPVSPVSHGSLTINTNGTFDYTPAINYYGTDQFQYQICDNGSPSLCATATVSLTINNVNDAPNAVDDAPPATGEDTQLSGFNLLTNDSDIENNTIAINTTPVVNVSHGTLTINVDGTFDYMPAPNYTGNDSFQYQICDNGSPSRCDVATVNLTIVNTNDSPVAVADAPNAINEETSITAYNLLDNDYDIDGNTITIDQTPTVDVSHGTLTINADGTFDYTPDIDYFGPDNFQYRICDDGIPSLCATANVTISILDVNDPPTAIDDNPLAINEESSITGYDLLANDSDKEDNNLTITTTPTSNVTDGVLTINADGTFDYTPNPNFNGVDDFQYEVCDDGSPSRCATATVTITVNNINDAPTPVADTPTAILEETSLTGFDLLANDTDPDNDNLSIVTSPVINVSQGSLTINTDGTFDYTPNVDYSGTDNFTYRVCDNGSPVLCATAGVTITITNVNDAPVAVTDNVPAINEDASITGYNIISNDTDVENNTLTINTTAVSGVSHGTLTINANGTFNYTPTANYNGTDQFQYQICDNGSPSRCTTGTVNITITPQNDAPTIIGETVSVNEDASISAYNLLTNDSDIDGDNLIVNTTPVQLTQHGSLTINADGTFNYTPTANYNGADSFQYEVCDNGSPTLCNTATVSISVLPINDAPVANADNATVVEDNSLSNIDLLGNDSDIDLDVLIINTVAVSDVTHGSLTINANGTFNYTPDANYNGSDSFEYEVCDNAGTPLCNSAIVTITITPANDAPTVTGEAITIAEDASITTYNLLQNDTDIDGNAISITTTPTIPASHGTLTIYSNGTFDYTPDLNYNGTDTFQYEVCDNASPSLCSTGDVTITITPVNDAPTIVADTANIVEDNTLNTYNLLLNDSDIEGNSLTINTTPVSSVSHGTLAIISDGTFVYTPSANYNGTDGFTYQVCDNGSPSRCNTTTVLINVTPVNDAPTILGETVWVNEDASISGYNLLNNDSDIDEDALTVNVTAVVLPNDGSLTINADGTFDYTPTANFNGTDSFQYQVCDDGSPSLCNIATVTLEVNPMNDAPTVIGETTSVAEDASIAGFDLLINDSDIDGDALTISTIAITPVTNGLLTINTDGTFDYSPNPDFNGTDSFEYEVCDNAGADQLCSSATVNITITPVNDAPNINIDAIAILEEETISNYDLLGNDDDIDAGDIITINTTPISYASNGTLTINSDGSFNYTPNNNYSGTDTFIYEACDDDLSSLCDTALVTITISPTNDAPVVTSETINIDEDNSITNYDIIINDTDPDGDAISINTIAVTPAQNGSLTINADGTFIYTPDANFNGIDSFEYEVCDNVSPSLCSTGSVTINIAPVNDAPAANNDFAFANPGDIILIDVQSNDTDIDGNTLTTSISIASVYGTATVIAGDQIQFTADAVYQGYDTITYQVCDDDASSLCDEAMVVISTITADMPPVAIVDNATVYEDSQIKIDVQGNDSDPNGDPISTALHIAPLHGTAIVVNNDSIIYTPNADYFGTDELQYIIFDTTVSPMSDTATVFITILNTNDKPVAIDNGGFIVNEDETLNGTDLTADDTDIDGDNLFISTNPAAPAANGILVINADGTFTYTPSSNYNGTDSFEYKVCDNGSPVKCDTGLVSITITPVNDKPVANNDALTVAEDAALNSSDILTNDTDIENNTISIDTNPVSTPASGSLTIFADGSVEYIPNTDFYGNDSFEYRICDDGIPSMCDTGLVTIIITPTSDKPVAQNDTISINEEEAISALSITGNDTDPDGNLLTMSITPVDNIDHGSLQLNANGTFDYTPTINYYGIDSFAYRVCDNGTPAMCDTATVIINIANINDTPVAGNDSDSTNEDMTISNILLTGNDYDIENNTLSINTTPIVDVNYGNLLINANNTYSYTPNPNFNGTDSFQYEICDNGTPSECTTASVIITVRSVNDKPVAVNDTVTINEDTEISNFDVFANDTDVDTNSLTMTITPLNENANGDLTLRSNGTFDFSPSADFFGTNTFQYIVCDNGSPSLCDTTEVVIIINNVNDAPVVVSESFTINEDYTLADTNLIANDSDIEGDGLSINTTPTVLPSNGVVSINIDGTFTYTPNANYNGTDSFSYTVCDDGTPSECSTGIVSISITQINDKPIANDNTFNITEDNSISGFNIISDDTDPDGNSLTVSSTAVSTTQHGTLVLQSNGNFDYIPNQDYYGTDSFEYKVCDNGIPSLCDTALVEINIENVNDAPVTTEDFIETDEDVAITAYDIISNDSDIENNLLSITTNPIEDVAHGSLTIRSDGTFDYYPNLNYNGTDWFSYMICDNGIPSQCAIDTVFISINAVNDAPIATDDTITISEEEAITEYSIIANDSDIDNDPLLIFVTPLNEATNGALTLRTVGTFDFIPDIDYYGTNSFEYLVCDNQSPALCDTGRVTIIISNTNDRPLAANDNFIIAEDTPLQNGNLTENDTDIENNTLTINTTPITSISDGGLTINADGTFNYSPSTNYNGTVTFSYEVCDNGTPSQCDTASVSIEVTPVNDKPRLFNDVIVIEEGGSVNEYDILANDRDVDADALTINIVPIQDVTNGVLIIHSSGLIDYTPGTNFTGNVFFDYEVCDNGSPSLCDTARVTITTTNINDKPVAVNDTISGFEDNQLVTVDIISNDTDIEGNLLTINTTAVSLPQHGALTINADGTFTYTPETNYNGQDLFEYSMCDDGVPSQCDTGLVIINLQPANDAPTTQVTEILIGESQPIIAYDLTSSVSDIDSDTFIFNSTADVEPQHGTVFINNDGTFDYTPNTGYNGIDGFTYRVCDDGSPSLCATGTVSITISNTNAKPVALNNTYLANEDIVLNGTSVLENDTDEDGDILTVTQTPVVNTTNGILVLNSDGTFVYTPNENYSGLETFSYEVCDNGIPTLCDTADVSIFVYAINDKPVANDDVYSIDENESISGENLLTNDTDIENHLFIINTNPVTGTSSGNLTILPDGTFTYTPILNFNGIDQFEYQVCDNGTPSMCDTATVTIAVAVVNEKPVAENFTVQTDEDVAIANSSIQSHISDVDNNELTISLDESITVSHGIVEYTTDFSEFNFTPNPEYYGTDSFAYIVCDNGIPSLCDTGIVTIEVISVNDKPVAVNDSYFTDMNTAISGNNLLSNDSDIDNELAINTTPLQSTTNGTLTINADGTFEFIPAENYSGTDAFLYEVCDNGSPVLCDTAEVDIAIALINTAPVATDITIEIQEDSTINSYSLIDNVTDIEGNILTVELITTTEVQHGVIQLNAEATGFNYLPDENFFGTDSFEYQVCDNGQPSLCDTAIVTITIQPVNDKPVAVADTFYIDTDAIITNQNIIGNDSDIDNSLLTINTIALANVSNGSLTINTDGTFNYTPEIGYSGIDQFIYEICDDGTPSLCDSAIVTIAVAVSNNQPVANDIFIEINEDDTITGFDLTEYATDADGNTLQYQEYAYQTAANGILNIQPSGTFDYIPSTNYNGTEVFTYEVCDDGFPSMCDTGIVTISILSVNDKPVAVSDTFYIDTDVIIENQDIIGNDSDIDNSLLTINTIALANISHGSLTINTDGTFNYTPEIGYSGLDQFTYEVCDNGTPSLCDSATVTIAIGVSNIQPVANDIFIEIDEDDTITGFDLTAFATDEDGNSLRYHEYAYQTVANGILNVRSTGIFDYLPNPNYNGTEMFTYYVCDDGFPSMCDTGAVTIQINAVNDAPIDHNNPITISEDESIIAYNFITNIFDIEFDSLIISATPAEEPQHGEILITSTGNFDYIPDSNYFGDDSFMYFVCDDGSPSACDTFQIDIVITPVNDAPRVIDPNQNIHIQPADTALICFDVIDPDGDNISISEISQTTHGSIITDSTICIQYIASPEYIGTEELYIIYTDGNGTTDSAFVHLYISDIINDYVALNQDPFYVSDTLNRLDILANDTIIGDYELTISYLTGNGIVTIQDSVLMYQPNISFCGRDTLMYYIKTQEDNLIDSAKVAIFVTPADTDNDRIPDFIEQLPDESMIDYDLNTNLIAYHYDSDNDGIPNYLDTDSDNDNIFDSTEARISISGCTYSLRDTDSDGFPDFVDIDSDNDSIADSIEVGIGNIPIDTDQDETPDYLDDDSDDDGKFDIDEGTEDCDGDGIPNYVDADDPCPGDIKAPEVFTPNGDGVNDLFVIEGLEEYEQNSIEIFNRWGNKVYKVNNYNNDWDGTSESAFTIGDLLPEGTYFYVLEVNNGAIVIKGFVYLKR